jgi:hypothetical protein
LHRDFIIQKPKWGNGGLEVENYIKVDRSANVRPSPLVSWRSFTILYAQYFGIPASSLGIMGDVLDKFSLNILFIMCSDRKFHSFNSGNNGKNLEYWF